MTEVKYPVKREKLSEREVILLPPSVKQMKIEAVNRLDLDFQAWARELLKTELSKLLSDA